LVNDFIFLINSGANLRGCLVNDLMDGVGPIEFQLSAFGSKAIGRNFEDGKIQRGSTAEPI